MTVHFMIGSTYTGRCSDGVTRTITVDDVSRASSDGSCPGLYLSGLDADRYRHGAYVEWTTMAGYLADARKSERQ